MGRVKLSPHPASDWPRLLWDLPSRIGKQSGGPNCAHCSGDEDCPEHTLAICPAWTEERNALKLVLDVGDGTVLSLAIVVGAALRDRRAWTALSTFAGSIMRSKESAERARQSNARAVSAP